MPCLFTSISYRTYMSYYAQFSWWYVRVVRMKDFYHPFEHKFFAQISRSFPLLSRLMLFNAKEQKEEHEEKSSIINFSHLVEFACHNVHIDYVEQFLYDSNRRLPCLNKIHISYRDLVSVTENFTSSATSMNCAKLKHILFDQKNGNGTFERLLSLLSFIAVNNLLITYNHSNLTIFRSIRSLSSNRVKFSSLLKFRNQIYMYIYFSA